MKKSFSALCLTLAVLLGITAVLYGEYTRPVTETCHDGMGLLSGSVGIEFVLE